MNVNVNLHLWFRIGVMSSGIRVVFGEGLWVKNRRVVKVMVEFVSVCERWMEGLEGKTSKALI